MKNALPSHLSHQAALAVILHESSPHYDGVQRVRAATTRRSSAGRRTSNLLYPFLSAPSEQLPMIAERVQRAVANVAPIDGGFASLSQFQHSARRATVFLAPDASTHDALVSLQAKLQAAFPECDHDKRAFAPHLTLGQAEGGVQATAALRSAMEAQLLPLPPWAIASVVVLERNGRDDPFRVVHQVPLRG
ncbi:hypothetical protein SPRG_00184 [Saprolegnia parasitica CBS 223.65]|uniref:Uncharacterized protein n=1 Tax=Saprolegnia parasitica (strain CBS 223.65) TaxID=695850 RepID=A0A067D1G4_SAPPC|nr:hypothetical protein SPRG_00184 [Saprolegnia parasitica CBS 223.65]KDO35335.1 hypothetical protein SPRG_00184 [Saprolegnia parasitica CBS 223.65]|eukprot:XP_012193681.1 hypothetical protein SPRG_00184 [Saprolegnia parasitica CBS 223.65]